MSFQTLIHPLMIPLVPQLYLWTKLLYGESCSIKTHLHRLRSQQVLLTQLPILLSEDRSQTKESPEVAAVPMCGVIITDMAS